MAVYFYKKYKPMGHATPRQICVCKKTGHPLRTIKFQQVMVKSKKLNWVHPSTGFTLCVHMINATTTEGFELSSIKSSVCV